MMLPPLPALWDLREESASALEAYARIPSVFTAQSVFAVQRTATGWALQEQAVAPFTKDYDALEDPRHWPRDFDTRRWVVLAGFVGGLRVGGAIVAVATPGVDMLEGRTDLAVLWDLRVDAAHRRQSVATALVRAALAWARRAGCSELKVETQNNNPAACRFYARNGFVLAEAHAGAYADLPDEVQLIWRQRLADGTAPRQSARGR